MTNIKPFDQNAVIGSRNWLSKLALRIGSRNWPSKLALQIGYIETEFAHQIGSRNWPSKLALEIGSEISPIGSTNWYI